MKTTILFPSDYFDKKKPDFNYEDEFNIAKSFLEFEVALVDYDSFIEDDILKVYPLDSIKGNCIYRGWMLKPSKYSIFYDKLREKGFKLINSPEEYEKCHLFPNIYNDIKYYTPKSLWFYDVSKIDWNLINKEFKAFMIKDFVKSVKGQDFPVKFETIVENEKMDEYIGEFIKLRGNLFTGGIVFKDFVNLKKYYGITNEYRCFYLNGDVLSISKNSNQSRDFNVLPEHLLNKFINLKSNFYTIDFAELKNGDWIIIETGDGQVSDLSPDQFVFGFYDEVRRILKCQE